MAKQILRERGWRAIRDAGVARFPGVEGRIPNFAGAEVAADRLCGTAEWQRAHHLKCNPDSPQLPVRKQALRDGKVVYMAVPKLADPKPFWRLHRLENVPGPLRVTAVVGLHSAVRVFAQPGLAGRS